MTEKDPYIRRQFEEEGISLRELLLILIRGKKTIIWITLAVFLITVIGVTAAPRINISTKGTVQTAVQLYFSGIEIGQTPTGGTYDVNEIKSADVLQNAIDGIDFGSQTISLEKLKNNISFQAVVPDSVAETLQNLKDIKDDSIKMEQLEKLQGYSDIYIVKLNLANDLGLDEEQGRVLLDNIIMEYKAQLIDKYGDDAVLADVFASDFDLNQYDYIQSADILNDQLERMELYVENHMPQTNADSTITGLNPADISSALKSIRTVDMERIYTMIGAFYLTKDPTKVVALYEKLAEDNEKAAAQYTEEAASIKAAIANFKKDDQTIVLGNMSTEPLNLKNENEAYNDLVTKYIEAGTKASSAAEDAKYYRSEAVRFQTALPTNRENSLKAAQEEESINLLGDKLGYWTGIINETAKDYDSQTTYQHYAEQLMPARSYESMQEGPSMALMAAIGLVLGLVLGVLVVLFKTYMKEDHFKQAEQGVDGDEN